MDNIRLSTFLNRKAKMGDQNEHQRHLNSSISEIYARVAAEHLLYIYPDLLRLKHMLH